MSQPARASFFFAILLSLNTTTNASAAPNPDSRTSHYTCDLDVSLAANDASASVFAKASKADLRSPDSSLKNKNARPKVAGTHTANLIGRGVANCKNQQGFQFNIPAVMSISLNSESAIPLDEIRATVQPISVERDVNKIFDSYEPHVIVENTPAATPSAGTARAVVVKGEKNDVLLQVNIGVPSEYSAEVQVSKVNLRFDGNPPRGE